MIRTTLMVVLASPVFGQSFEVASVKVHEGPMRRLGVTTTGQRLTADCSNVRMLVMFADNVKNFQVTGLAPLLKDDQARWDIVARSGGDGTPTRAEFRTMMQALLAERFQLQVHREMREMPVYALVVGKNGSKFKASDPEADPTQHYSLRGRNNFITMPKAGMSDIVDAVSNAFLDRPVVDKTGLTGIYNIQLTYTPNAPINRETETDLGDISVFQAVEEQLGLKLEARKEMVEMLVVDRAEKPSGN